MNLTGDFFSERRPFDTIELERLQFGAQMAAVDKDVVFQRAEFSQWEDEVNQRLVRMLRANIWAEPPKRIECRYPTTWRDAFKERWFPAWAKKKWPVEYTITTLEGQIFYPRLPQTVPENRFNLRLVVKKESSFLSYDDIGEDDPIR